MASGWVAAVVIPYHYFDAKISLRLGRICSNLVLRYSGASPVIRSPHGRTRSTRSQPVSKFFPCGEPNSLESSPAGTARADCTAPDLYCDVPQRRRDQYADAHAGRSYVEHNRALPPVSRSRVRSRNGNHSSCGRSCFLWRTASIHRAELRIPAVSAADPGTEAGRCSSGCRRLRRDREVSRMS